MPPGACLENLERLQAQKMERYYRLHAHLYDCTRWSFLFGRRDLLERTTHFIAPERILEVGCGTGVNLAALAALFPRAELTGLDLASSMLEKSSRRLKQFGRRIALLERNYTAPLCPGSYDLVLFAYTLSMINPGWQRALDAARHDLRAGGSLAIVDFHTAGPAWFATWMGVNHVRMNGELLPHLKQEFMPRHLVVYPAYCGLWQYFSFIGGLPSDRQR